MKRSNNPGYMVQFAPCFDRGKVERFAPWIDRTLNEIERAAVMEGRSIPVWPPMIDCMTHGEVAEGEQHGKGHGLYEDGRIAINPHMDWHGIYLNLIHEAFHHAIPRLTDSQINDFYLPLVYQSVTGRKLKKGEWKKWRGTNPCWRNG